MLRLFYGNKKLILLCLLWFVSHMCVEPFLATAVCAPDQSYGYPALNDSPVNDPDKAGALWTAGFSDPYFMGTSMTSTPVLAENHVYVVNRDILYELDKTTGSVQRELALPARMNSVCDPVISAGYMYIPLSDGILTAVDLKGFKTEWTSENFSTKDGLSYQTLGRLTYHEGYLYAGVWSSVDKNTAISGSDGVFFCINAENGHTVWTYRNTDPAEKAGFYWTQACICKNRVFFTSENGWLISHALCEDTVYQKMHLTYTRSDSGARIRCGLTPDENGDNIYTASQTGTLIRIKLSSAGVIASLDTKEIIPNCASSGTINCTSTPALYDNRIYIGCAADHYGRLCVFDADNLKPVFQAQGPKNGEIKSRPLVIPDDPDDDSGSQGDTDHVSVYVTANESSGSLYCFRNGALQRLFAPYSSRQFCLANVVSDTTGVLYYSNDSGTLFAIGKTDHSADIRIERPENLKLKKTKNKKKLVISWKDPRKNIEEIITTYIYYRAGKGKWNLLSKTTKESKTVKMNRFPRNKKLRFRLKNKVKYNNKTYDSSYTKTKSISY